jgi:hypothetical protein
MTENINQLKTIAKNPLGILSLMISLIYGIACLVFSIGSSNLTPDEKIPLIYFIAIFPFAILYALYKLVIDHHTKLYSPADFKDESNFIKALKDIKYKPELNNTSTNNNLIIKENNVKELEETQKNYFELIKLLIYFMHKDKNKEINNLIIKELPEMGKKMAVFLERSFINKGTIKEVDRIFK